MRHPKTRRWVVFQCIPQVDGHVKKTPFTLIGKLASIADSRTWSSFDECIKAMQFSIGNALGFALDSDYKMAFIDLDKCILPDGTITPTARKYVDRLEPADPFIERSISGMGLHLLFWYTGSKPKVNPESGVEIYTEDRFVVLTGVPPW